MESILDYLRRKLKEAGPSRWAQIAKETGLLEGTLRKLAYELNRNNPGLKTVEPLLDYFQSVERGERELPSDSPQVVTPTYRGPDRRKAARA